MQKIEQIADSYADSKQEFTEGDLYLGILPTTLRAVWLNTVQRELVAVIEKLGGTLNPEQDDQVYQALAHVLPLQAHPALPCIHTHTGLAIYPHVVTPDAKLRIIDNTNGTITIASEQIFFWRGVWEIHTEDYSEEKRTFTLNSNNTYHLRWRPEVGFILCHLTDMQYNPNSLSEIDRRFDTQIDDMLAAKLQTDVHNTPTILSLVNQKNLYTTWEKNHQKNSSPITDAPFWLQQPTATLTLNWSRTPTPALAGISGWNFGHSYRASIVHNDNSLGVTATRYTAYMYDTTRDEVPEFSQFYYLLEA